MRRQVPARLRAVLAAWAERLQVVQGRTQAVLRVEEAELRVRRAAVVPTTRVPQAPQDSPLKIR
jgi:hypothetical protein